MHDNTRDMLFKRLRAPCEEEYHKMKYCYQESQNAFQRGDKAQAKELSEQGKVHDITAK